MRLVHLTDPHLSSLDGVRFTNLRGKRWSGYLSWRMNRAKRYLPAVLQEIASAVGAEDADQILVTGDLVHIGLEREVDEAARWLKTLGPPERVMLVPGNHDVYASDSLTLASRAWAGYLGQGDGRESPGFPVARVVGGVCLVGLSSACVTPVFVASGKLGRDQLQRLEVLLAKAADQEQLVCLLIHHPPLTGMTDWRKGLADAAELEAVLSRFPPPLVFHGHLHHNREYLWGESRIYCTAAASSASEASYRVIDIESDDTCWKIHMTLKSLVLNPRGEPTTVTVDEQKWQMNRRLTSSGGV